MARIGGRTVHITLDDHSIVTLRPGQIVPEDLERYFVGEPGKPHRALARDEAPAADDAPLPEPEADGDGYEDKTVKQLQDLLKDRELPQDGKKDELVARLREADSEPAPSIDEDLGDPGDGETEQTEE